MSTIPTGPTPPSMDAVLMKRTMRIYGWRHNCQDKKGDNLFFFNSCLDNGEHYSRPAEKNITIKTEKITREMQYAMQEMQKQVEEKKKTVETIQKEIQDCEAKIVELKEAINKINYKDDVRKE